VAATGQRVALDLGANEQSFTHFRAVLAANTNVAPEHQILLCGPPYKSFDRTQLYEASNKAKDLFLYDRRIIQGDEATLQSLGDTPHALPGEVRALEKPTESATSSLVAGGNPLDIALSNYELQFLHLLRNSEAYGRAADARLSTGVSVFGELQVQHRAAQAAVLNLRDHANPLREEFRSVEDALGKQRVKHDELLRRFPPALSGLEAVPLHAALPRPDVNLRSLADCVPVDKEMQWLEQCTSGHNKIGDLLNKARDDVTVLDSQARGVLEEVLGPGELPSAAAEAMPNQEELAAQVGALREVAQTQRARLSETQGQYEEVKITVLAQLRSPSGMDASTTALETCRSFEELLQKKQNLFEQWVEDDARSCNTCAAIAERKRDSSRQLGARLQLISRLQFKIQKVQQTLTLLRTMKERQDQDFRHLEHIIHLKDAYEAFLVEVARRRSYAKSFASKITEFRHAEVERREKFWRHHGHHLPPVFYEWMPSLAKPPPYFSPEAPQSEGFLPEIQSLAAAVSEPTAEEEKRSPGKDKLLRGSVILEAEDDDDGRAEAERQRQLVADLEYENLNLKAELQQLRAQLAEQPSGAKADSSKAEFEYENLDLKAELLLLRAQVGKASAEGAAVVSTSIQDSEASEPGQPLMAGSLDAALCESLIAIVNDVVQKPEERGRLVEALQRGVDREFLGAILLQIRENAREGAQKRDMVVALEDKLRKMEEDCDRRIAYHSLAVGDVALFLPTDPSPEDNQFRPFHARGASIFMFMHPLSVAAARAASNGKPEYVVGKIIQIEDYDSGEHKNITAQNQVPAGCIVAQVEILDSAGSEPPAVANASPNV